MLFERSITGRITLLAVAVIGCGLPFPAISFLAAVVLALWLPGRACTRLLAAICAGPGAAWIAIASSFVVIPLVAAVLWRFPLDRWTLLACIAALDAGLIVVSSRIAAPRDAPAMFANARVRRSFTALVLYVGACVFGTFWLPTAFDRVGVQAAHDYIKHHAVLQSLERGPLPLRNMFYALEADTPYYYYEHFYYVPATLRKLTGDRVSIAASFGFSSALLASTFIALTYLVAGGLLGRGWGALGAAACVSVIGGWDVLAFLGRPPIVLDAWCPTPWRVHNVFTQFVWCPQHVAATVALLLAAIWLQRGPRARCWIIVAPLLGAFIFGASVYLAITYFLGAAVFVALRWMPLRRDPARLRSEACVILAITVIGAALMAERAWHYLVMSRRFPGGLTLEWERFPRALLGGWLPPGVLANYLDLPWMLLIDLGVCGLALLCVAAAFWKRVWLDDGTRLLLVSGVLGTLALYTVRSDVNPFDYGFRVAVFPLQVVGAICAAALLTGQQVRPALRRWARPAAVLGAAVGASVGFYEAPLMTLRTLLLPTPYAQDAGAIGYLRDRTPADSIVQADPVARLHLPELIGRRMGVLDPDHSHTRVFYPRDESRWRATFENVQRAFETASTAEAYEWLRAAGVTHVLDGSIESPGPATLPQFQDPSRFELVYEDDAARVYRLRE